MVTKVGLQTNFISALRDLVELDFDAIEAYDAAINRLESDSYKSKMSEFKADHVKHTEAINAFLSENDEEEVNGPSAKSLLTQGKVVIAEMLGDMAILAAMLTNEIDTNTAYERLNAHQEKNPDIAAFLRQGLQDEMKHKNWIEKEINRLRDK